MYSLTVRSSQHRQISTSDDPIPYFYVAASDYPRPFFVYINSLENFTTNHECHKFVVQVDRSGSGTCVILSPSKYDMDGNPFESLRPDESNTLSDCSAVLMSSQYIFSVTLRRVPGGYERNRSEGHVRIAIDPVTTAPMWARLLLREKKNDI